MSRPARPRSATVVTSARCTATGPSSSRYAGALAAFGARSSSTCGGSLTATNAPASSTSPASRSTHGAPATAPRPAPTAAAADDEATEATFIRALALTGLSPGGRTLGRAALRATPYARDRTSAARASG